jgi:hypothetical protein
MSVERTASITLKGLGSVWVGGGAFGSGVGVGGPGVGVGASGRSSVAAKPSGNG